MSVDFNPVVSSFGSGTSDELIVHTVDLLAFGQGKPVPFVEGSYVNEGFMGEFERGFEPLPVNQLAGKVLQKISGLKQSMGAQGHIGSIVDRAFEESQASNSRFTQSSIANNRAMKNLTRDLDCLDIEASEVDFGPIIEKQQPTLIDSSIFHNQMMADAQMGLAVGKTISTIGLAVGDVGYRLVRGAVNGSIRTAEQVYDSSLKIAEEVRDSAFVKSSVETVQKVCDSHPLAQKACRGAVEIAQSCAEQFSEENRAVESYREDV